uniref:Uncharacterized protein n=1 Tax=viral metagenome TaxID=1070528 RepID=A0A6C0BER9_9ZZZZ
MEDKDKYALAIFIIIVIVAIIVFILLLYYSYYPSSSSDYCSNDEDVDLYTKTYSSNNVHKIEEDFSTIIDNIKNPVLLRRDILDQNKNKRNTLSYSIVGLNNNTTKKVEDEIEIYDKPPLDDLLKDSSTSMTGGNKNIHTSILDYHQEIKNVYYPAGIMLQITFNGSVTTPNLYNIISTQLIEQNIDDAYLVNPGFKIDVYSDQTWSTKTGSYDNTFGNIAKIFYPSYLNIGTGQSVKVYFKEKEIVLPGISYQLNTNATSTDLTAVSLLNGEYISKASNTTNILNPLNTNVATEPSSQVVTDKTQLSFIKQENANSVLNTVRSNILNRDTFNSIEIPKVNLSNINTNFKVKKSTVRKQNFKRDSNIIPTQNFDDNLESSIEKLKKELNEYSV